VLLILLNMLLAIIMDTYVAAKGEAGEPTEQLTIWTQVKDACYTLKETKGHISPYTILLSLQDEDYPAHPAPIVTAKSLRRAFQNQMSKHQAEYIMRKTVQWIKSKDQEVELGLTDSIRLLSLLKVNILRGVGGGPPGSRGSRAGFGYAEAPAPAAGMANMAGALEQLQAGMQTLQRQQEMFMDSMQQQLADQRRYIEERDSWLEQRIGALERRCEKVERGSDKVLNTLQGVDWDHLAQDMSGNRQSLERLLNMRHSGNVPAALTEQSGSSSSTRPAHGKDVVAKLEEVGKQVEELVNRAAETAEQRSLLWKIDLGIRQLRQEGLKIAQQSPPRTVSAAERQNSRMTMRAGLRSSMSLGSMSPDSPQSGAAEVPGVQSSSPPQRIPGVPGRSPGMAADADRGSTPPRPTDIDAQRG